MSVLNSGKYKSMLGFKRLSLTWANRPSASAYADEIFFASDIGANGTYFMSNGTYWVPVGGEAVLAKSAVPISLTGTTSETVVLAYTLPGGLMTTWSQIEVVCLWSYTNSANNKIFRVRNLAVGGVPGGDAFYSNTVTTTATLQHIVCMRSDNSTTAQKGWGIGSTGPSGLGAIASTMRQFARNMASDSDITISAQLASAAETITLEGYTITLRS